MSGELVRLLSDLKEPEALAFVEKALAEGASGTGQGSHEHRGPEICKF